MVIDEINQLRGHLYALSIAGVLFGLSLIILWRRVSRIADSPKQLERDRD